VSRRAAIATTQTRTRSKSTKRKESRRKPAGRAAAPRDESSTTRAVKAAPHRFTKMMVSFALVVTLVVLAGQWALHQSIFRVQHVTLLGVHHETTAQVLAASGLESHPTMVGLSASAVERNLMSFTWIRSVSLAKHWPNSVIVTVHESVSVAVAFNSKHQLQFVDAEGHDLGAAPLNANYPTLVWTNPTTATWPFERAGRDAALVASQLPKAFAAQVSQVIETPNGVITLKMTTPVTFVLGPATLLRAKFGAIASVIARTTLKPGDIVDVSVPDELAVTGAPPS
jgi:cell division protein FtsQ